MVKKAVQAASARDASSSSTIGIQISDIDAEFGDTDPLTLLERFKVCVSFSACIFVIVCIEMTRLFLPFFADIRRRFLQSCPKSHLSSNSVHQGGAHPPHLLSLMHFVEFHALASDFVNSIIDDGGYGLKSQFTTQNRRATPASGTCCFSAIRAQAKRPLRSRWDNFCT